MQPLRKLLRPQLILWVLIIAYAAYFSSFTVLRYKTLYASYFDLGIMHQTVHNTYMSLKTGDFSRFLELTDPLGSGQLKRMGVHNDILLALIAPFYFLHDSPATLLVIQSVIVALGALAVFLITSVVFNKSKYKGAVSLAFALSYLLNPVLQRANIYDFHAVVLATTTLLFMFYFFIRKRYYLSFLFLLLSLMAKEQVSLVTAFFGIYSFFILRKDKKNATFPIVVFLTSVVWFIGSVFIAIPYFRGEQHFAVARYDDFGDSPGSILTGLLKNPSVVFHRIFHPDTYRYFLFLLGPVGFLSVLALPVLLIAAPEFGINLLSSSWNMRNIIYQYTAVIQPFIFISAIYGAAFLTKLLSKKFSVKKPEKIIIGYIFLSVIVFAFWKGPLPFSREKEIHPFKYPQKEMHDAADWGRFLKDDSLKISSTGQLAPFFTGRRYFYTFNENYVLADYVAIRLNEIYNYSEKKVLIPVYERLKRDTRFELIYQKKNFEVYKQIK